MSAEGVDREVQAAQDHAGGGLPAVAGDATQHVPHLAHGHGGMQIVAGDVADDQSGVTAFRQDEAVIPVTADLRCGARE